jgi:Immunity protein 32
MDTDKLLTFELSEKGDELFVVADSRGLRFLAAKLTRLAEKMDKGEPDHEHLMTKEWAGNELSSAAQVDNTTLLNHVKIYARPQIEK